jgi:hypothetical protein
MKSTILTMSAVLVLAGSLFAQSTQLTSEVFSWNGELVAPDANSRVMTVKAPIVGQQTPAAFQRLKTGERVMLTWSGYDKYADAIRDVRSSSLVNKSDERFTFPAEFASFDAERRYATFKMVPENSIGNLMTLKPGEWVTATSPHGALAKSTPVTMVRPYVEHTSAINSN